MIFKILKYVFDIFEKEDVRAVIYFGNKGGLDIDIFVVINKDIEYNCIKRDKLDITYAGGERLNEMVLHWDPLITEPIMSGETIYGDISGICEKINTTTVPLREICDYLDKKARQFIQWAEIYFQRGDLVNVCECLRFAISFSCFFRYYQGGQSLTTFHMIMSEYKNESIFIEELEILAKYQKGLRLSYIDKVLEKAKIYIDK